MDGDKYKVEVDLVGVEFEVIGWLFIDFAMICILHSCFIIVIKIDT